MMTMKKRKPHIGEESCQKADPPSETRMLQYVYMFYYRLEYLWLKRKLPLNVCLYVSY
jgi:hypothetical protein